MNYIVKTIVALSLCMMTSCLNIDKEDAITDPKAIKDISTAKDFLASIYLSIDNNMPDLSILAGDFVQADPISSKGGLVKHYQWDKETITEVSNSIWLAKYYTIAQCDILLERDFMIITNGDNEVKEKKSILAEVKAIKAYSYLNLLKLYSNTDNLSNPGVVIKSKFGVENLKRSTVGESINEIETLLTDAYRDILKDEDVKTKEEKVKTNITPTFIKCLQAEVALLEKDYNKVEEITQNIWDSNKSKLSKEFYKDLWQVGKISGESIFAWKSSKISIYLDIKTEKEGDVFLPNPKLESGNENDIRDYTKHTISIGDTVAVDVIGKYSKTNNEKKEISQVHLYRLPRVAFMLAEAKIEKENLSEATKVLNDYLDMRGAEKIDEGLSKEDLMSAMLLEETREYMGEGVMFSEKKRHKEDIDILSLSGGTIKTIKGDDYRWLFPIPASEFKNNSNIEQNPQWPKNFE